MKIDKSGVLDVIKYYTATTKRTNRKLTDLLKAINALPATEDEWVSVDEKYSNMGERVLCLTSSSCMYVGYVLNNEWVRDADGKEFERIGYTITHWQPLPSPPTKAP